ncbi:sugar ABC transporter substrate-binding protein, partial [Pseudomonas sp. 2995-3]
MQTRYGQLLVSHADVCIRQLASGCLVSVLKGTVQVRDLSGQMATLQAGQQAPLKAGGLGARALFDVLQLGWRDGVG